MATGSAGSGLTREPGALVIGGGYRALGVVRSLGRRGIPVWVLTNDHLVATASRYMRRELPWPRDETEQLQFLFDLHCEHGLDGWALIPSDEEAAAFLDRHHSELSERYRLTTPPWEILRWGYGKRLTHQLACELGIDQPKTYTPSNHEELAALDCHFPVILKPAFKAEMNRFTRAKAWRADNRDKLLSAYDEACNLIDPQLILIQEFIPGGGEEQFSYAALCIDGKPVASIAACRRRQHPRDFGRASSCVESIHAPEIESISRRLLSAVRFTGLVELEFKRDLRDGCYKLLDINSRVWGWHTLAQRAGVDFPYLLWRAVQGLPIQEVRGRVGVRWVRMLTDIPATLEERVRGRLSPVSYIRSFKDPLEFSIFAKDDPLPAVIDVPCMAWLVAKRFFRRGGGEKKANKSLRVCMISHSIYEDDYRVLRYAEALVQRGDSVDVFSLRRLPETPKKEVINGVNVTRIQDRFHKNARTKSEILLPLLRFLAVSTWHVTRRHWRRPYDVVHVHNIPDFLVFAAAYPKLTGAKVILDVHDIVPEFFATKFNAAPDSLSVRVLKLLERLCARFADHVILSNDLWLEKYTLRTAPKSKCSVFINHVDRTIFRPAPRPRNEKPVILFPGGLQPHQGVDIAIRAFAKLKKRLPQAEFHIYGDGPMKQPWIALASQLGLNGSVVFHEPLRLREIAEVISRAHLGIVPKRGDAFGNEAFSTKILEFMAAGVPVVVSSTKVDRYYFDDSLVRFFPSGDVDALADAMYEVLTNPELQARLVSSGTQHAARNDWETRKPEYLQLVDSLRAA